jgi:hypothetical protein
LEILAPNIARDSAGGIAALLAHVEQLDHPERPNCCLGCTGSSLINQRFRAVGDTLNFEAAEARQ